MIITAIELTAAAVREIVDYIVRDTHRSFQAKPDPEKCRAFLEICSG